MFGGGKLWQNSNQKLLVSETLVNSCLFAFCIVQIINLEGKILQITSNLPNSSVFSSPKLLRYMVLNIKSVDGAKMMHIKVNTFICMKSFIL